MCRLRAFTRIAELAVDELQREGSHDHRGHGGEPARRRRVILGGPTEERGDSTAPQVRHPGLHGSQAEQRTRDSNADARGHHGVDGEVLVLVEILRFTRGDVTDGTNDATEAFVA